MHKRCKLPNSNLHATFDGAKPAPSQREVQQLHLGLGPAQRVLASTLISVSAESSMKSAFLLTSPPLPSAALGCGSEVPEVCGSPKIHQI